MSPIRQKTTLPWLIFHSAARTADPCPVGVWVFTIFYVQCSVG